MNNLCNGTGSISCHCGGDLCVCGIDGSECPGCSGCEHAEGYDLSDEEIDEIRREIDRSLHIYDPTWGSTESLVCQDIFARQKLGIQKYQTTVSESTVLIGDWLQHAYEECLDQAIYLKRAMQELKRNADSDVQELSE